MPYRLVDDFLPVLIVRREGAADAASVANMLGWVEKLTLQLLKARRAQFGSSSEQLDRQIALIEAEPLEEQSAAEAVAKRQAANRANADRRLPVHLTARLGGDRPLRRCAPSPPAPLATGGKTG